MKQWWNLICDIVKDDQMLFIFYLLTISSENISMKFVKYEH